MQEKKIIFHHAANLQSHSPSVLPATATFHQRSLPGGGYIANLRRLVKFDTSLRIMLSITIGLPYYIGRPMRFSRGSEGPRGPLHPTPFKTSKKNIATTWGHKFCKSSGPPSDKFLDLLLRVLLRFFQFVFIVSFYLCKKNVIRNYPPGSDIYLYLLVPVLTPC